MNNEFMEISEIKAELYTRYPQLISCDDQISSAFKMLCDCYENKGTIYIAGNGGSAADSEHIVGELMKSFMAHRRLSNSLSNSLSSDYGEEGKKLAAELEGGLPAISLPSLVSISTALINDSVAENTYSQLIATLGKPGDVFWGISTSGNSRNVVKAAMTAKAVGLHVLGLCGKNTAKLDYYSDVVIHVPETETFKVQELHLPVYHALCAMLESYFFSE